MRRGALGSARAGRAIQQAVYIGEQHQQVGVQLMRQLLGQAVVVRETRALGALLHMRCCSVRDMRAFLCACQPAILRLEGV